MNQEYLNRIKRRTANGSIGRSTLRSQGASGVVAVARTYLCEINLENIKDINSEKDFLEFLNCHTNTLANAFPEGARGNWGAARKAINIFLRDCLYNQYICSKYSIAKFEGWLEVPLDGDVGKALKAVCPDAPKWTSIKSLKIDVSDVYQKCANNIAADDNIARVHLDVKYWRGGQ